MFKLSISIPIILLLQLIPFSTSFGHNLHDLNRPYYCSTCFSNTQDQNYHCCFYFFKCCADARRGSRSTTPSPRYPGVPSQMTFIVQNRKSPPCSAIDCSDAKLATNLCCHMQNPQKTNSQNPSSFESDTRIFKTAVNIQSVELDGAGPVYQNASDEGGKTYETTTETSTEITSTGEEVEMNANPFNVNTKGGHSDRKLFIPPSLAVDHVIGDSDQKGDGGLKQGWFTKEILKHSEDES